MKTNLLFGILILTILISGCSLQTPTGKVIETIQTQEEPFCAESGFEYQNGKCCLDSNSNKICDNDELITKELEAVNKKQPEIVVEETNLVMPGVPEECPYDCGKEHECKPVYNADHRISRWACVYVKE